MYPLSLFYLLNTNLIIFEACMQKYDCNSVTKKGDIYLCKDCKSEICSCIYSLNLFPFLFYTLITLDLTFSLFNQKPTCSLGTVLAGITLIPSSSSFCPILLFLFVFFFFFWIILVYLNYGRYWRQLQIPFFFFHYVVGIHFQCDNIFHCCCFCWNAYMENQVEEVYPTRE